MARRSRLGSSRFPPEANAGSGQVFVGRERELAVLQAGVLEVIAGHGRLFLLAGEPGIGKTRLAQQLAAYARPHARILWGRCWEGGGAPPYWPWVEILRGYVRTCKPTWLRAQISAGASEIAQLVPELGSTDAGTNALRPSPSCVSGATLDGAFGARQFSDSARFQLFDSVTTLIRRAVQDRPLVLVLEDLHWADTPSMLLLRFLSRLMADARLLVIGTYRDSEVDRGHPFFPCLGELVSEPVTRRLGLTGLSEQEVARCIELSAGAKPSTEVAAAIYRRTDGNPFFVNEVIHILLADGADLASISHSPIDLPVPASVWAAVQRRIDRLSGECVEVLCAAAVIGGEFDAAVLTKVVLAQAAAVRSRHQVLNLLDEARAAGLLLPKPATPQRYSFSHAHIRDVLYEGLPTARRMELHRAVGEALEACATANPDAHLAELAHHFLMADSADKAIEYCTRAAEQATQRLAFEEAVGHYQRALQMLSLHNEEPAIRGADKTPLCQLLLALGDAQRAVGDTGDARETFYRAAVLARGLRTCIGTYETGLLLGRAALGFGGWWPVPGANDRTLIGLLDESLDVFGSEGGALRACLLARLAMELAWTESVERVVSLGQQATEVARSLRDPVALAYAVSARHLLPIQVEPLTELCAAAAESVQLAEECGSAAVALRVRKFLVDDLLVLGDVTAADGHIEAHARVSQDLRQPFEEWWAHVFRAMRALLDGRFSEAEKAAFQALAVGERAERTMTHLWFGLQMLALRIERGELRDEDASNVERFARENEALPLSRCIAAVIHAELGNQVAAQREFEHFAAREFTNVLGYPEVGSSIACLAQVCARLSDARRAATLYEFLRPYAAYNVTIGPAVVWHGPVSYYLGVLAATMCRYEDASRHFEEALAMSSEMGARPWLARTQESYAATLLSGGRRDDRTKALELAAQALATARELGMKAVEEKAEALTEKARGVSAATERPSVQPLHSSAAGPRSVFVGRERELAALQAGVREAVAGHGRLFLVTGEPGIGKTRLAQEVAVYARSHARVLWGRCHESEGAPAFWPWIQVMRTYLRETEPVLLQADMGPGAAHIAQVFPEVRDRLPELATPPSLPPEQERFRFFDSFTGFLKAAAARTPLVVVLDDLHGADKPSLLLLQFLAREIADAGLLVLGAYRETELSGNHPLFEAVGELVRVEVTNRIPLSGLNEGEVTRYLEMAAGGNAPAKLAAAVHKQTDGNPFFVGEVVRLLITEGFRSGSADSQAAGEMPIPPGVREAIGRRLSRLSADCNAVLSTAAVIGRDFELRVLERVVGIQPHTRFLDVLDEARAFGVLKAAPTQREGYSFAHALIRETMYDALPTAQRMDLHRRVAKVLETAYSNDLEPHLTALAHHFVEGVQACHDQGPGDDGDLQKAIKYSVRAAEQASAQLAYEEAAAHYDRALHVLDLDNREPSGGIRVEAQRCELLLALGESQNRAGGSGIARETFHRAAAAVRRLRRQLGDRQAAPFLVRVVGGLGFNLEGGKVDELLVGSCSDALEALANSDSRGRALVLAQLAVALSWSDAVERRTVLIQEALEIARRLGDKALLASILNAGHHATWRPDNMDDRLSAASEVVRLAEQVGDTHLMMQGHWARVADLLEAGDIGTVDLEMAEFSRLARQLRQPLYLWIALLLRAMRALLDGRYAEAEQLAQDASVLGQRAQNPSAPQAFAAQTFALRTVQLRLGELESAVEGFVQQYPGWPVWRCALAYLHTELGSELNARQEFEHLAADDFARVPRDSAWLLAMSLLSEVCAFLGDGCRAAVLYDLLRPYASCNIVVPVAVVCRGSAAHFLGLLARTTGCYDDAAKHFEDALTMNTRMGSRPLVADTQYEYAATLLSRGQPGDPGTARDLLSTALKTARELGMEELVQKATGLLERRGVQRTASAAEEGGTRGDKPAPVASALDAEQMNVFHKVGDYWRIVYAGTAAQLKDMKGFSYLAQLLRYPGREFHVMELVELVEPRGDVATATLQRRVPSPIEEPLVDAQALNAYRDRLVELRDELAEAEARNDLERATQAREEIAALTGELATAFRTSKAGLPAERARVAVTKTLARGLKKIAVSNAALGRHLGATIKTGYFCAYVPDPRVPVEWQL